MADEEPSPEQVPADEPMEEVDDGSGRQKKTIRKKTEAQKNALEAAYIGAYTRGSSCDPLSCCQRWTKLWRLLQWVHCSLLWGLMRWLAE